MVDQYAILSVRVSPWQLYRSSLRDLLGVLTNVSTGALHDMDTNQQTLYRSRLDDLMTRAVARIETERTVGGDSYISRHTHLERGPSTVRAPMDSTEDTDDKNKTATDLAIPQWRICGLHTVGDERKAHRDSSVGYTCGLWMLFHFMTGDLQLRTGALAHGLVIVDPRDIESFVESVQWTHSLNLDVELFTKGTRAHSGATVWNLRLGGRMAAEESKGLVHPLTVRDAIYTFMHNFFGCSYCRDHFEYGCSQCVYGYCNITESVTSENYLRLQFWLWQFHNSATERIMIEHMGSSNINYSDSNSATELVVNSTIRYKYTASRATLLNNESASLKSNILDESMKKRNSYSNVNQPSGRTNDEESPGEVLMLDASDIQWPIKECGGKCRLSNLNASVSGSSSRQEQRISATPARHHGILWDQDQVHRYLHHAYWDKHWNNGGNRLVHPSTARSQEPDDHAAELSATSVHVNHSAHGDSPS
eukprot:gene1093-1232_t